VLLAALDPDASRFAGQRDVDWSAVPWGWLLGRARGHKLHPLLVARLDRHDLTRHVPQRQQLQLAEIRDEARRKSAAAAATLRQIAEVCARQGIPLALLKGSYLAEHVYGEATHRVFSDVDILVPRERVTETERALETLGYALRAPYEVERSLGARAGGGEREEIRRVLFERYHHLPLALPRDDPRLPVDAHWLLAKPQRLQLDPAELWPRLVPATVCGVRTQVLDPEAMLVHLALHAAEQSPLDFKLLHLCDVAWFLERFGGGLDVERVARTAVDWGVARQLACCLEALCRVFPFPAPEIERRLGQGRRRAALACRLAGIGPRLVDQASPRSRGLRLLLRLFRETVWDLALGRPPRRARGTLHGSLGRRLATLSGLGRRPRRGVDGGPG
jgi:hypothetical protein